jgi:hypothetical protein
MRRKSMYLPLPIVLTWSIARRVATLLEPEGRKRGWS